MMRLDRLPSQRPNEHLILFLRRHWFALVGIISSFLLLAGIPILLIWYYFSTVKQWLIDPLFGPVFIVIASIYFLSLWLLTFLELPTTTSTWVVTNERIINTEQHGLFVRTASELDLTSIQDVTSETRGFLQTMFNYGNVLVQTAGEPFPFQTYPSSRTCQRDRKQTH